MYCGADVVKVLLEDRNLWAKLKILFVDTKAESLFIKLDSTYE